MKYNKIFAVVMLASGAMLMGACDLYARGGGGHGGGMHGGGGWSGNRGGGYSRGGESFHGGGEFNRQHDWNQDNHIRPNPDHNRPRPTPPAPPPPPTYNVNVNGPDGWWYGGADDALAGMAMGTMMGVAVAGSKDNDSGPTTVIVENPAPAQYVQQPQPVAVGNQSAMLPQGSQARSVNGTIYYQNGETWYRPYFGVNGVYYEVVPSPGAQPQ